MKRNLFINILPVVALILLAALGASAQEPALPPVKVKARVTDPVWMEKVPRTVAVLPGFKADKPPSLDKWGGRSDRTTKATGFFRVEKASDRWWLVDPDGHPFLHVGVAGVDVGSTPTNQTALKEQFGIPGVWADKTGDYLRGLGFNGAGAWSGVAALRNAAPQNRLVYTVIGNAGAPDAPPGGRGGFMSGFGKKLRATRPGVGHTTYPNNCIPVFHPDFPAFCDTFARPLAAFKDDPYLLGYFSDNELPVPSLDKYLALPPDDPTMGSSYKAAQTWLDARKGKPSTLADVTDADRDAFIEYAYDRYFAITTGAIRKYDPNHLCLGSRFYSTEKSSPGAFRAAGRYLDVISVNLYFVWSPKPADFARWTNWSDKPVIITEWYAKGMDSGLANTSGAGWTVPTQEDRGLFYETFTLGLLEAKNCVGWHWFKYMDNDPTAPNAEASNVDGNKGLVTSRYVPYAPLADHMRTLNRNVYALTDYFDKRDKK